jgi:hypothetical protein
MAAMIRNEIVNALVQTINELEHKLAEVQDQLSGMHVALSNQAKTIESYQLEDPNVRSCGLVTRGDLMARIRALEEFISV